MSDTSEAPKLSPTDNLTVKSEQVCYIEESMLRS